MATNDTPRATSGSKEPSGPVPMHHRLKLGEDVINNPQGDGSPGGQQKGSTERKGW